MRLNGVVVSCTGARVTMSRILWASVVSCMYCTLLYVLCVCVCVCVVCVCLYSSYFLCGLQAAFRCVIKTLHSYFEFGETKSGTSLHSSIVESKKSFIEAFKIPNALGTPQGEKAKVCDAYYIHAHILTPIRTCI